MTKRKRMTLHHDTDTILLLVREDQRVKDAPRDDMYSLSSSVHNLLVTRPGHWYWPGTLHCTNNTSASCEVA